MADVPFPVAEAMHHRWRFLPGVGIKRGSFSGSITDLHALDPLVREGCRA
jgi:hypothetical protein